MRVFRPVSELQKKTLASGNFELVSGNDINSNKNYYYDQIFAYINSTHQNAYNFHTFTKLTFWRVGVGEEKYSKINNNNRNILPVR